MRPARGGCDASHCKDPVTLSCPGRSVVLHGGHKGSWCRRGRALEELALGDLQDKVLALLLRELLAFEVQRFGKQKLFLAAPVSSLL